MGNRWQHSRKPRTNQMSTETKKLGQEPAFAGMADYGGVDRQYFPGLSQREYFAGLAMHGLLASHDRDMVLNMNAIASIAVECADALLKELNK